ncbi:MAG: hypothetical protein UU78_C0007G0016 [Candidatus Roizmanbacteria bacterium GW2011_GWC2_41_7]|uniref:NAD(P)-binding domain-containing protein n=1 Tax=Candidatus Roizmanbacteria bacterium GW2011_GWC2_41_7 TaxID=1618487 RepID=A0A0G1ACG8_9BACT|nr:MAG: hypothetical protein UU78_C0007G0016 [Candidatus Roizmanbacteria bacterium GW2011_GWC2_41_7]
MQAILKAIDYNPTGIEYFDICTGTLTSLNDIVKILALHTKKEIQVAYDTSVQNDPYLLQKKYLSAKEKLGWKPEITLSQGLKTV